MRQFQAAHALSPDGLVGPDTWAALFPFAVQPGVDADANGIIDPFEVATAAPTTTTTTPTATTTPPPSPIDSIDGFADQELFYLADGSVTLIDGAPTSLRDIGVWYVAGDGAGLGTNGLSLNWVRLGDHDGLISSTIMFDAGGQRVNDTVDIGPLGGQTISRTCFAGGTPTGEIDEIGDSAVFGVVASGQPEPVPAARAFEVLVPEGTITEIDPAGITCQDEGGA